MEQGGNPSSLDGVFNSILNDQTLQEQVRQAEEQQRRAEEKEWAKPPPLQ